MNSRLLFTTLLLLLFYNASAQLSMGTKISVLNPTADIGPYFKKSPCYELFLISGSKEERFRGRAGLIYASLQPRLDSFPTFMYRGGNDPMFFPGKTVYTELQLPMVYCGFEVKTLQYKDFTWYFGTNLAIGYAMMKYKREVKTLLEEEGIVDEIIGGLIFRTAFEYSVSKRFDISVELSKSSIVPSKWTPSYGHYNYGIGITYLLNRDYE